MMVKTFKSKGFVVLDALISIMVFSIAFAVLLEIGVLALKISSSSRETVQANSLLKESIEAVRNFRDGTNWTTNGLATLNTGESNPYYLILDTGQNPPQWSFVAGQETVGIFTRKIIFDNVSRDPTTKDIENVYNISHDDSDTRKITATVAWGSKLLQLATYLTNWKNE